MPKLNKQQAKKVGDAEGNDFLLDEGFYVATLLDVSDGHQGPSGEYWRWEFGSLCWWDPETGEYDEDDSKPGKQWLNTSLSDAAAWKLNETFLAFGVDPGTDTDELVGEKVRLFISQRVIEKGKRQGELGNSIDSVHPLDEGEEPEAEEG